MNHLDKLEAQSVYILREAYREFKSLCMLWSIGKDSTVLLWLARKVEPLSRKLSTLSAWICGLRRSQSVTRKQLELVEWDETFGLFKLNPLVLASEEWIWEYIREHDVPYNELHDKGYPSIGCAPCTRAVEPGEDIRAGRWWWEQPELKECGLHGAHAHQR